MLPVLEPLIPTDPIVNVAGMTLELVRVNVSVMVAGAVTYCSLDAALLSVNASLVNVQVICRRRPA
jgi:hypothetical protein